MIGLSILSARTASRSRTWEALREAGGDDIPCRGRDHPEADVAALREAGVAAVYTEDFEASGSWPTLSRWWPSGTASRRRPREAVNPRGQVGPPILSGGIVVALSTGPAAAVRPCGCAVADADTTRRFMHTPGGFEPFPWRSPRSR